MAAAIRCLLTSTNPIDGCFVVGDNCERIGFVKQLVANRSPVFRRMLFDSDMKETGDIVMPDIHPEAIKLYLKYAYGALEVPSMKGEMTGWSPEVCLHVVDFTEKYEVPALQEIALRQLKPTGVDDLFPALHCVTLYSGAASLASDVLKIIQENIKKFLQSTDFLHISLQSLLFILKQDILSITEVELFNATVAWAKHQGQTDKVEKIKPLMTAPLQHLRLLTISHDDLYRHIEPSKLFSFQEITDLGKAISNIPVKIRFCDNSMKKRVTPAPKTLSVDLQQVSPTKKRVTPAPKTVSVDLQQVSPTKKRVTPAPKTVSVVLHLTSLTSNYARAPCSMYMIKLTEKPMKLSKIVCYPSQNGCSYMRNVQLTLRMKKNQITIWEFQNTYTYTDYYGVSLSWENMTSVVLEPHLQYILEVEFGDDMFGVSFNHDHKNHDPHCYVVRDLHGNPSASCTGHTFSNGSISCISKGIKSFYGVCRVSHIKLIEFTEV